MKENKPKTCGLDLGDKYSHLCVIDEEGAVVEESRIQTTKAALRSYFRLRQPMRVVLEVGTHSPWVSRLVGAAGHETIVANPRRVRLIAENHKKSDTVDSELLARLGRFDPQLLSPIQHRREQTHIDRVQIRARASLVESRTRLINSIRGMVKSAGYRLPQCSTSTFGKRSEAIPEELRETLLPMMECVGKLTEQIKLYDERIQVCARERHPDTEPLRSIAGVGDLTALTFALTLEDPCRFKNGRAAAAFLGLTSRRRQSGETDPDLRISKRGDRYLRQLLVQSAH